MISRRTGPKLSSAASQTTGFGLSPIAEAAFPPRGTPARVSPQGNGSCSSTATIACVSALFERYCARRNVGRMLLRSTASTHGSTRMGAGLGMRRLLRRRAKPSGHVLTRLVAGNFIVNGGVMIVRATSFAAACGFDEAMRYCEDWHCWCRLAAQGEFQFIPDLLLDYRVHNNNTMNASDSLSARFLAGR